MTKAQKRHRKKQLFEQLRLQAEILCDSHEESRQTIVLNRMMRVILDIVGERKINQAARQALADHFTDCATSTLPTVELGGPHVRNAIHLDGHFDIGDLAKRITWTEARGW
jgi:hypothetical protein